MSSHADADCHRENENEVSKKQRNKAFRGRKPFYGNTASSSAESSSDPCGTGKEASSQIACARTDADVDAGV